jgi:hypothetical protein
MSKPVKGLGRAYYTQASVRNHSAGMCQSVAPAAMMRWAELAFPVPKPPVSYCLFALGVVVTKAIFLSWISALLVVTLPWWLGSATTQLINELGALDYSGRSLANGAFLLSGAFWMGTVEAVRKQLEPQRLDAWLRFGTIAFAASLIGRMVFPCDLNCPLDGSVTQLVHNTLVWVLYAGALIAGWRLPNLNVTVALLKGLLLACFVLLQWGFWHRDGWPGLWQRGYEASFAVLWLIWVHHLTRAENAKADQ